jgi:hypothetical protein
VLRRKEALPDGVVELEITHARGALHVRGARDSAELRKRIARMFQLHVDLTDFYRLTRASPSHAWSRPGSDASSAAARCGRTR